MTDAIRPTAGGRGLLRLAIPWLLAVLLTLASSALPQTRLEVQDWDCPPAPASCARPVLVLGAPIPYISDYHGISVVGRASLLGALLGEDLFHAWAFWTDVLVYWLAIVAGWWVARRRAAGRRS